MPTHLTTCVQSKARFFCTRVMLSRVTMAFFILTTLFCAGQAVLYLAFHNLDRANASSLAQIIGHSQISSKNFAFLQNSKSDLILQSCYDIPHGQTPYPCTVIFNATRTSHASDRAVYLPSISIEHNLVNTAEQGSVGGVGSAVEVVEVTLNHTESRVSLGDECIKILVYPSQVLANFGREDIALFSLQIWLCVVSFLALFYGSIPHLMAVFATRVLAWAWSVSTLWRMPIMRDNFQQLQSPCSLDLFTHFWDIRRGYQIGDLLLNSIGLSLFAYLSTTLFRVFDDESFARLGAPRHVLHINKFFLALLACLQMEAFFLMASIGLWADTLMTTVIAQLSSHTKLYQFTWITTNIATIPWIVMGWYAIRREMRRTMILFLGIAFAITAVWAIMFYSIVYRWTFTTWPFLACLTVCSFALLLASMVLGVVCRRNFGKGLAEYLRAERALASQNFAPDKFSNDIGSHSTTTTTIRSQGNHEKTGTVQDSLSPTPVYHVPFPVDFSSSSLEDDVEKCLTAKQAAIVINVTQTHTVS